MDYVKLIIATCTVAPLGYAWGGGLAWLFGAHTPSMFGAGVGALFVLLAMLQSVNGKSVRESDGKKAELVAFTLDPTAVDLSDDDTGPYVVMRKRKSGH